MRIGIDLCEFTSNHSGGKDQVAYNLIKGFIANGHRKEIKCFCHEEFVEVLRKIDNDIQIVVVPDFQLNNGFRRRIKTGKYIRNIANLSKLDLVLFTTKRSPLVRFECKTVVIPHDIQVFESGKYPGVKYPFKYCIIERLYLYIDFIFRNNVIAISDFDRNEMCKFMSWVKNKVVVISDPIEFGNVENAENVKYITALNIQWKHKNVETLIKAFALIHEKTDLELMLVGKKPANYDELNAFCKNNMIENKVHFAGFVSTEELSEIISYSAIYVNPSFYEGFGMTAVEMMGNCIPTIVASNTAMPGVTLGLCRYYEPTDDEEALAAQILKLLTAPVAKEKLEKVSKVMRDTYSYITIAKSYWFFFESIKC
jgi:glycosyltransferase involved in cell wall biosynthesis